MFEATSAGVRRFFDFLGSIFCGLIFGFILSQEVSRFIQTSRFLFIALFIIAGLAIYLAFYKLVWRFLNQRFLLGYANFLIISILSVSIAAPFAIAVRLLMINRNPDFSFDQLELFISNLSPDGVLLFYWATSLPMAFFWLVGWLTAWKFRERKFLR